MTRGAHPLIGLVGLAPRRLTVNLLEAKASLGRLILRWRSRKERKQAILLLAEVIRSVRVDPELPPPEVWRVQRIIWTSNDVVVALFGARPYGSLAYARIGGQCSDGAGINRNSNNLSLLHADPRVQSIHALLPTPLAQGKTRGRAYAVERALPGRRVGRNFSRSKTFQSMSESAVDTISILHRATATWRVVGESELSSWVHGPITVIRRALSGLPAAEFDNCLARLEKHMTAMLLGQSVAVSWTHGDYWFGNILVDAHHREVTGIVDWDAASDVGLPALDIQLLVLSTRVAAQGVDLGLVMAELLETFAWTTCERRLLSTAAWSLPEGWAEGRTIALLTWLSHVSAVIEKRSSHASDHGWVDRNIDTVLRALRS